MAGSTSIVHTTLQITAIIGAAGLMLCMAILSIGLVIVIAHDGNTQEVNAAMTIIGNIVPSMVYAAAALAGAVGAVSAFVGRMGNGTLPSTQSPTPPQG
jgi:hypothetical protein